MSAEPANRKDGVHKQPNPLGLTLVVGSLTVLLALLSMLAGNRLSTLHAQHQEKQQKTAASNMDVRNKLKIDLEQTAASLSKTKQALADEKRKNDQLSRKMVDAQKTIQTLQTELARANERNEVLAPGNIPPVPSESRPPSAEPESPNASSTKKRVQNEPSGQFQEVDGQSPTPAN